MKIQLVEIENPELRKPILVSGLPGSAYVGKFALDHLVSDLRAKPLAELYTDGYPPQVLIREDGSAALLKNELYYLKRDPGSDVIFFTGDAQPSSSESDYRLSDYLVQLAKSKYSVQLVVTLGAYVTGAYTDDPKTYATGTNSDLAKALEAAGCIIMRDGAITGMNGLLLGMAKLYGIEGYSLLGETEGYAFDPRASEIVLESLSKLTHIESDLKTLRQKGKDALETLKQIEQMSSENREDQNSRSRLGYIS